MKSFRLSYSSTTFALGILALCVLILSACGFKGDESKGTGSIAFSIKVEGEPASQLSTGLKPDGDSGYLYAIDCAATGVATVEGSIYNYSSNYLAGSGQLGCSLHAGSITTVPAGWNYSLTVQGRDASGNVIYSGTLTGITVATGVTNNVGEITITPGGGGTWATKTAMPTAREGLTSDVVNGKIYVIGGYNNGFLNTVEEYDPAANTWSTKTAMPTAREGLTSSVVNGKIYAIGGWNYNSKNMVQEYDPTTDTWSTKTSMPTARYGLTSSVVNGKMYVIGGRGTGGILDTVEEYDPATDSWTTKTDMPKNRSALTSSVVNGKIYVIGGKNYGGRLNTVEEYDPATDSWTTKTDMPTAREDLTSSVVNGKIYVIGGGYSKNAVEEYDPATDSWATKTAMPTAREDLTSSVVNGKIYAIGGTYGASLVNTVEEYTPPGP